VISSPLGLLQFRADPYNFPAVVQSVESLVIRAFFRF
jgi:hypothetical protein